MSTMHAPAEVTIHGRHIEVSQKFREHVLHKIGRIEKFGIHVTRVDVEVTKEPNPRQHDHAFEVELTIAAKGPVIRAEASAPDKFTAFDLAYARLEELRSLVGQPRIEVSGKRGIAGFKFKKIDVDQTYTQFDDQPKFEEIAKFDRL